MTLFKITPYYKILILTIWFLSAYSSYAWSETVPGKTSQQLDQCVALGDWIVPGSGSGIGNTAPNSSLNKTSSNFS